MIWLIITIAVILLYLFALAPRLRSAAMPLAFFRHHVCPPGAITARSEAYRKIL
ncbi:MAG: hypothetical protein ACLTLQ_16555 [[Clostridium] scindens]